MVGAIPKIDSLLPLKHPNRIIQQFHIPDLAMARDYSSDIREIGFHFSDGLRPSCGIRISQIAKTCSQFLNQTSAKKHLI